MQGIMLVILMVLISTTPLAEAGGVVYPSYRAPVTTISIHGNGSASGMVIGPYGRPSSIHVRAPSVSVPDTNGGRTNSPGRTYELIGTPNQRIEATYRKLEAFGQTFEWRDEIRREKGID